MVQDHDSSLNFNRYETYNLGSGFSTTYMDYSELSDGSLFFDIIDSKRKQLVWTSKVTGDIKDSDILREEDIYRLVKKAFKHFPPR